MFNLFFYLQETQIESSSSSPEAKRHQGGPFNPCTVLELNNNGSIAIIQSCKEVKEVIEQLKVLAQVCIWTNHPFPDSEILKKDILKHHICKKLPFLIVDWDSLISKDSHLTFAYKQYKQFKLNSKLGQL